MEKDRCDNEKEVFNARVREDEMVITIEEYTAMRKQIEELEKAERAMKNYANTFERKEKEFLDEKRQILTELECYRRRIKINLKIYVKSLFIIYRYNKMKETLRIMKNNLKLLKGGR